MQYDPIKKRLGVFFNKKPWLRKLFYHLLDLLLLRTWHVHQEVKRWTRHHKQNANILDAGSGFGQYSFYLSSLSRDYKITAVDVKEDQIEDCSEFFEKIGRSNVTFSVEDLTKYQKPGTFQLIISVDVMEHILEDEQVFRNFYASLAEGGTLIISTPSDQGGSDVHEHDHESFIDEHVRDGYNILEIQQKLHNAGFENVKARFVYGSPGKVSWRLSMKYPILLLNKSYFFIILLPLYYLIAFPVSLVLNFFDLKLNHKTGTGLIVKAIK